MTHPLLSSPGNTAAQLQPVEHAASNKNGKSGSNAAAQNNGNDFKAMVRELSSDGQSKSEAMAGPNTRSGEAASGTQNQSQSQSQSPGAENAANASKIAIQRNPEANNGQLEELVEDDSKLEEQGLAAQEDQEQAAGDTADGDEQTGLQQARPVATPVAAEEDDELLSEEEEGLSEEYELEASPELPEDGDGENALPADKLAQDDSGEGAPTVQDATANTDDRRRIDIAATAQPQPAVPQRDGEAEIRPTERQPVQQSVQPQARPEDALRASLERINSATTPTDADNRSASAPVQNGEANRLASAGSPSADPANQPDAATKPTVVQPSQISLTDGQLRAIQNATSAAQSRSQTIESSQAQANPQVPDAAGDERLSASD